MKQVNAGIFKRNESQSISSVSEENYSPPTPPPSARAPVPNMYPHPVDKNQAVNTTMCIIL